MHPLLARTSRLGLYLLAWLPLTGILAALLVFAGALSWAEGSALAVPLIAVYAFVCLSSWYLCRSMPLRRTRPARIAGTLGMAAAVAAALWVLLAATIASFLEAFPPFAALPDRLGRADFVILVLGFLLYVLVAGFHYVLLAVQAGEEHERREAELKLLAQAAELKLLKDQLNPHFLFNALNSISALTASDPARAREMCVRLSEFLRQTLGLGERSSISLKEELALARNYLAVEQVRFGERLRVEETIDPDSLECPVPPLLLQPLVENAVKHGIARLTGGGLLRLTTRRDGERVQISVENPVDADSSAVEGKGVGLANVRRRVSVRYGDKGSLTQQLTTDLFRVEIWVPA